jgi:tRNA threonylcarbamoyladenosine biosynthesis protein TsaE
VLIITHSPEETQTIASQLAGFLTAGDVICLHGDLGAGKTTFTQGLARGLGITDVVNSPTFSLVSEYKGRLPLYHMDVYRLGEHAADEPLGYEEYFYGDGVTVVEWSELIQSILPDERFHITIRILDDGERSINITGEGERPVSLIKEWEQHGVSRP